MGALAVISFEIIEGVTKFTKIMTTHWYQTLELVHGIKHSMQLFLINIHIANLRERERATCIQNIFSFFFFLSRYINERKLFPSLSSPYLSVEICLEQRIIRAIPQILEDLVSCSWATQLIQKLDEEMTQHGQLSNLECSSTRLALGFILYFVLQLFIQWIISVLVP